MSTPSPSPAPMKPKPKNNSPSPSNGTADTPPPDELGAASCSASLEAVQYADYILNHYSRDSYADKLCLARDLERHGWHLPERPILSNGLHK